MRARVLVYLCLALLQSAAPAQLETFNEQPIVDGKDVIWVPTPNAAVDQMLLIARVSKNDLVVDLGSGDGKIVIAAAKRFGARARGVEYSVDLIAVSRRNAENRRGRRPRAVRAEATSSKRTSATRRS